MAEPKIEDVTEKEPEVKIEEVDDDAPPALEEKDEAGDAAGDEGAAATGHRAKQSRSEKKTRKQIQKLGMKPVSDVVRMTVKKGKQVSSTIGGRRCRAALLGEAGSPRWWQSSRTRRPLCTMLTTLRCRFSLL